MRVGRQRTSGVARVLRVYMYHVQPLLGVGGLAGRQDEALRGKQG